MDFFNTLETFGYLFYVVSPNRTTFEKVEDVPDFTVQVVPFFFIFIVLERAAMKLKHNPLRINDLVASVSQGVFREIFRILFENWRLAAYIYVYTNWRIVTLPWDSLWTWFIAFLGADFGYYWAHRASHEINILWAAHQVHHSSEDFNMTTALRQSALQNYFMLLLYLPLALIVPPAAFLVHFHFNLLTQFWIHTELVKSLGPLEYILNTPSHHRVHHGSNKYCIDTNYGGALIIWDRLFGTFAAEKEEQVTYGLTSPINTFEPLYIQFCHFRHMWRMFWFVDGWKNKLSVIFKGPGWAPGKPRLGDPNDIPEVVVSAKKFDPLLPSWCIPYMFWHFLIIVLAYVESAENSKVMPPSILYGTIVYEIFSLSCLGHLMDGKLFISWLELLRCILYIAVDYYFIPWTRFSIISPLLQTALLLAIRGTFLVSSIVWMTICVQSVTIKLHKKL